MGAHLSPPLGRYRRTARGADQRPFTKAEPSWSFPPHPGDITAVNLPRGGPTGEVSVAVTGVLVHHLGPSQFFPVAGGVVAVAILGGLTQRAFGAFGATEDGGGQAASPNAASPNAASPEAADDLKAAEGSRK